MKATAKKTTKNSSHKAKSAVVDELRWAVVFCDVCHVFAAGCTRANTTSARNNGWRIIRVRITEVTK